MYLERKEYQLQKNKRKKSLSYTKKGMGIREIQRHLKIEHPYSVTYAIKTANDNKNYITVK